jgi:flagellar basal-body rod protein FlgB
MDKLAGVDATQALLGAMKTAELNHRYLANNIANVDTPGFNPTNINFQKTLQSVLEGRDSLKLRGDSSRHFNFSKRTVEFERLAYLSKNDYNKVDLDDQLARLQENTGSYTAYAALLSKRFQMTKEMLNSLSR